MRRFQIKLGSISAVGATNEVTIGFYETGTTTYHKKNFSQDMEIAPLTGNITTMNSEVYLHLHVNLGDKTHKAYAGHLNKAVVSATFEAIIDVIEGEVNREFSDLVGLNLLDIK